MAATTPLQSVIAAGTKLWLDSVDPKEVAANRALGATAWGKKGSRAHKTRRTRAPATPAGLGALEEMCAAGITLNVTLIFSDRQYKAARDAVWRGAQRRSTQAAFKSVYSIFVSRVDV